jgi:adenylylsulfate kinase-like enzyme
MDDKLVIGLFGNIGSGKTTVADAMAEALWSSLRLDTEQFRGFTGSRDFSEEGRMANQKRLADLLDAVEGRMVVILSFNFPTPEIRAVLKERHNALFVHCDCPVEECRRRDFKGLYKGSDEGRPDCAHLSSIGIGFDPSGADMVVDTANRPGITPEGNARRCAQEIIDRLVSPWLASARDYAI